MLKIIIRTAVLYVFVILAVRMMGKRQIGDLQPSELVITLLISEIAAIPLQDADQPLLNGIAAIFVLVILEILTSVLAMKSLSLRKLLSGESVVLIKNGCLDQRAVKSVRMTVLDLVELLRSENVFDISQVAFAVLEVNGNLNVLLKEQNLPVTAKDMNIEKEAKGLQLPVITDGIIIEDSLKNIGKDRKYLSEILQKNNTTAENVFLMTLDRYGNTNIIKRN